MTVFGGEVFDKVRGHFYFCFIERMCKVIVVDGTFRFVMNYYFHFANSITDCQ